MAIAYNSYYGYLGMSDPDLSALALGKIRSLNHHKIKVRDEYDFATLQGDFHVNKHGQVSGGAISSVEFDFGSYRGTFFKQIHIGFRELFAAAKSKSLVDDAAIFAKLFAGDDELSGSVNTDHLNGWGGNDVLFAGDSGDILTGGAGADVFAIGWVPDAGWGQSRVTDFSQSEGDKISLVNFGSYEFADLNIYNEGEETILEAPTDTPSIPLRIHVHGMVALTESDFIL